MSFWLIHQCKEAHVVLVHCLYMAVVTVLLDSLIFPTSCVGQLGDILVYVINGGNCLTVKNGSTHTGTGPS